MSRRILLGTLTLLLLLGGSSAPAWAEDSGSEGTPNDAPVTVIIPKSTTPAVSPAPAPVGAGVGAGGPASVPPSTGGAPVPSCSIGEDGSPVVPPSPASTPNTLIVDRAAYSPGDTAHVTGGGYAASQPVRAMVFASPVIVADPMADAAGAVAYDFEIPADATTGELTVQLTGWNCGYVAAVTILVGDTVPAGFGGLPQLWWLLIVAGLAVLVLVLVILGKSHGWFGRPGSVVPVA